jgi:hypothetical protein
MFVAEGSASHHKNSFLALAAEDLHAQVQKLSHSLNPIGTRTFFSEISESSQIIPKNFPEIGDNWESPIKAFILAGCS